MKPLSDKLYDILKENGFYDGECCHMYGNDEDCCIDAFVEDFLLKNGVTNVITDIIETFDSPGYDSSVLSVAWNDTEGLHLETFLIESM